LKEQYIINLPNIERRGEKTPFDVYGACGTFYPNVAIFRICSGK
jgi:hypothetical protein